MWRVVQTKSGQAVPPVLTLIDKSQVGIFFRTLHHCQISPGTEWKSVLFSSRPISTMSSIHPRSLADCGRLVGLTENVSTPSNSEGYPPTMSRRSHFPAVIWDYWNAIRCSLLDCDFNVFGTITFRLVQGGRFPIWWRSCAHLYRLQSCVKLVRPRNRPVCAKMCSFISRI